MKRIIITGGAGFIGSNIIRAFNAEGINNIIVVDHLSHNIKKKNNLEGLVYNTYFDKDEFIEKIESNRIKDISLIIHLGARTDTTEKDKEFLMQNNTMYSKKVFTFCVHNDIRLIYASSAATYGNGSQGYSDKERNLEPLNFYGLSKYFFDEWVLTQKKKPSQWVGLKFFNVYGPYENHKGFMASVIMHGYSQIIKDKKLRLFKSYKPEYKDGQQKRDFIYIKDIVKIVTFFKNHKEISGIFNAGTGKARTFLDLGNALFASMGKKPDIQFIDMPVGLRSIYQYFTQADMSALKKVGYSDDFYELEDGIREYVEGYLMKKRRK